MGWGIGMEEPQEGNPEPPLQVLRAGNWPCLGTNTGHADTPDLATHSFMDGSVCVAQHLGCTWIQLKCLGSLRHHLFTTYYPLSLLRNTHAPYSVVLKGHFISFHQVLGYLWLSVMCYVTIPAWGILLFLETCF